MQGTLSSTCCIPSHLQHALCHRFSVLRIQQNCSVHKQTILDKLNLPPKPKKPASPFLKFLSQVRPSLVKEYPEVKNTDILKIAAQKWSVVDSKLKNKLIQEYKEEFVDYNKILSQYESGITPEQRAEIKRVKEHTLNAKEIRKTRKKAKELGKPKQPPSVFANYLVSKKSELVKYPTPREWLLSVAQEWKALSSDVKSKLQNERKLEYKKWTVELKAWEEKMIKEGHLDVVRTSSLLPPPKNKLEK